MSILKFSITVIDGTGISIKYKEIIIIIKIIINKYKKSLFFIYKFKKKDYYRNIIFF